MNKKLWLSAIMVSLVAGLTFASPGFAGTISDRLAQWGVNADLKLFGQNFFRNSQIKGGYNFAVQPSYSEGLYTRIDRYYFNTDIGHKGVDSLQEVSSDQFSLGMIMKHALEIEFARQFEDSKKAVVALPYGPKNIPFTSDMAIRNLNVGDFVSIKSNLAIVVGADFVKSLNISLGMTMSANYIISGAFQLNVLRLPENKVRLKLVGIRSKNKEYNAKIGYGGILNIFPVKVVENKLIQLLDLNPIQYHYNDGNANLFMVDYVLDLNDLEVAKAYNEVLDQTHELETSKILNPIGDSLKLRNQLSLDIAAIDSIFVGDHARGKVARVQRSFRGSADAESDKSSLRLGVKMVYYQNSNRYSESKISSVSEDSERANYILNSYKSVAEGSLFFSFLEVRREIQMNALFATDISFKNLLPENIVVGVERRDKRFRAAELRGVEAQLQRTIPKDIFDKIDFKSWKQSNKKIKNNVAVRYQVVLQPEAIDAAPEIGRHEIAERYLEYLQTVPVKGVISNRDGDELYLKNRVFAISRKLEKVFSRKFTDIERVNTLMSLRTSSLFKSTGLGFLLSLLPANRLESLIHFDLAMESSDGDRLKYSFGNKEVSPIYKKLLYIQSLLDNDGLDVRLQSEMLGLNIRQGTLQP